ncbi:MAG: nucleotidyltransferase family protein [bacterium]|nr:nucleotidyltransferase family protein [bacterium]
MNQTETLLCGIVRGDITSWPMEYDDYVDEVLGAAFHHRLHMLLYERLRATSVTGRWPTRLVETLKGASYNAAALDLVSENELRRVLRHLDAGGVRPLLMKGTPLAYTLYPSTISRPRGDTDLLTRESQAPQITRLLDDLGYRGQGLETRKIVSYQATLSHRDRLGIDHHLDVHWRINNAQIFASTLTYEELAAAAIALSSLSPVAYGLGRIHSLLLACIHRAGHAHAPFYAPGGPIHAGDHLLWAYDIHLLFTALSAEERSEFTSLAESKRIAGFCLDGLNAATAAFGDKSDYPKFHALEVAAQHEKSDVRRLSESRMAWFLANLRSLQPKQKLQFLKETVFPSPSYMRGKYETESSVMMPYYYLHRLVTGIAKKSPTDRPS